LILPSINLQSLYNQSIVSQVYKAKRSYQLILP